MDKIEATKILIDNVSYKIKILRKAIDAGADINVLNILDEPIFKAVFDESRISDPKVRLLIKAGAKIDLENNDGETALYSALSEKKWAKADFLISEGSNINAKNKFGETLLTTFLKICIRDYSPVYYLIQKGADINIKNDKGESPLKLAAIKNDLPLVEVMIEKGADTSTESVPTSEHSTMESEPTSEQNPDKQYTSIYASAYGQKLDDFINYESSYNGEIFFMDGLNDENKLKIKEKYPQIYADYIMMVKVRKYGV